MRDEFHRFFVAETSRLFVLFIIGVHILVEAAEQHRVRVGFDLCHHVNEPYRLDSLSEALRGELRDPSQVRGDIEQLLAALCVGAFFGALFRFISIAVRKSDNCLKRYLCRAPEGYLISVPRALRLE